MNAYGGLGFVVGVAKIDSAIFNGVFNQCFLSVFLVCGPSLWYNFIILGSGSEGVDDLAVPHRGDLGLRFFVSSFSAPSPFKLDSPDPLANLPNPLAGP